MAVAVISAPNQLSRRQVVRRTWANSSSYVTRFFIGFVDDKAIEEEVRREAEQFGDICRVSLVESYQGLLHKVLAVFSWFRQDTPVNILLKVDDDVLFDPDRLQLLLQLGDQTKQGKIWGAVQRGMRPHRTGRYAVSTEVFPGSFYPTFVIGSFYILDRESLMAVLLSAPTQANSSHLVPLEDVAIT